MKGNGTQNKYKTKLAPIVYLDLYVKDFGFNLGRVHPPSYWRQSKNLFSLANILLFLVRSRAFYPIAKYP